NGQGSAVCGSRNTSALASNGRGATAAKCDAARKSDAVGSPATGSAHRSGTICNVNGEAHSGGEAFHCPGIDAVRTARSERSNARLGKDHESRDQVGQRGRDTLGTL